MTGATTPDRSLNFSSTRWAFLILRATAEIFGRAEVPLRRADTRPLDVIVLDGVDLRVAVVREVPTLAVGDRRLLAAADAFD